MSSWVRDQIGRDLDRRIPVLLVLDPDRLLDHQDLAESGPERPVHWVSNWQEIRRVWDLEVRRRELIGELVIVQSSEFRTPDQLPWDVQHEASHICRIHWPVPDSLREVFKDSPRWRDDIAAAAESQPADRVVPKVFGLTPGLASSELDVIAKLRQDPSTPASLWDLLATAMRTQPAQGVAAARGDLGALQQAWGDWLEHGDQSANALTLGETPGPIIALLGAGLMTPVPMHAEALPSWVEIGAFDPNPSDIIAELLERRPPAAADFDGWVQTASWWGQVRAAVAAQPVETQITADAWAAWANIDEQFREWLFQTPGGYGSALMSSAKPPRSVDRIASFLASRIDGGGKALLIVVDGMSFAQWHQIRNAAKLRVVQATGSLAMIPTLTTVSRQSILAGALPHDFVDSIRTTAKEEQLWRAFWQSHGLAEQEVLYRKTMGADGADVPELHGRAVAVVVNAIDEMMHGSEVLGDRQLSAQTDLWVRAGFLESLVAQACAAGYEVWITADHGNMQSMPAEKGTVKREGQLVDHAGTRVRLYADRVFRDQADFGTAWDPPGYPTAAEPPLFADGRSGFHFTGLRVSHGGISLDEVIVPLVQVTV